MPKVTSKLPHPPRLNKRKNTYASRAEITAPGTIEITKDPTFEFLNPNQTTFSVLVDEDGARQLLLGVVPIYVADQIVEALRWTRELYKQEFYPDLTQLIREQSEKALEEAFARSMPQKDQNLGGAPGSEGSEGSAAGEASGIGDSLAKAAK